VGNTVNVPIGQSAPEKKIHTDFERNCLKTLVEGGVRVNADASHSMGTHML